MNITLHNPTDDQLDACFAERVAGYRRDDILRGFVAQGIDSFGKHWGCERIPAFTRSADAVLPWLEKCYVETEVKNYWSHSPAQHFTSEPRIWQVRAFSGNATGIGESPSFPRAAVIALLRAHGATVTFD